MTLYDPENANEVHDHVHSHIPSDPALRVKAMESLLVEKGLLTSEAVDVWVETYSEKVGPKVGAGIVARAWCNPDFKARLLEDGTAAIKELEIEGWFLAHLKVVENTDTVHNLVVCTLCSCYPHGVLGLQPSWYKKEAYRSRAVRDPRLVLSEFGVDLPEDLQEQAGGRKQLFSVHTEQGEQIALVADRQMAFVLARQNDMTPMAVH